MTINTKQQRHEAIAQRFPDGLTLAQFRMLALESANEEGQIDPPALADWFAAQSLLMGMWMEGLINKPGGRYDAGPWFITAKGIEERSRHV